MVALRRKFLLIDDDPDDADLFCEALKEVDPALQCAIISEGAKALIVLHDEELPEVIFLDINMPIVTGFDILKKLRADPAYDNILVIMYSTSSAPRDIKLSYQSGALAFLTKPESFKELREILKTLATTETDNLVSSLKSFPSFKGNLG